jgi:hypothetical protein
MCDGRSQAASGSVTLKVEPAPGALVASGAPFAAIARALHPVEALEDAAEVLLGDAGTAVADGNLQPVAVGARFDPDPAPLGGELDGVVQEVDQDLRQPVAVGADGREIGRHVHLERLPPGLGGRAHHSDGLGGRLRRRDRQEVEPGASLLHGGEIEQVLDEQPQPLGVTVDDPDEFGGARLIGEAAVQERLGVSLDGRERGAQLVRHVGDEFAARLLQALQLGDVVEHRDRSDHRAVVAVERRQAGVQDALLLAAQHLDLAAERCGRFERRLDGELQPRDARRLQRPQPFERRRRVENPLEGTVRQENPAGGIGQEHPFHHPLQHGAHLVALAQEQRQPLVELIGHAVEGALHVPHLVPPAGTEARPGVAGRQPRRRSRQAFEAPHQAPRGQHSEPRGQEHRGERRGRHRPAHRRAGAPHLVERHREAHHPLRRVVRIEAHRDVEKIASERVAVAHRAPFAVQEGRLHLGAIGMVLDVAQRFTVEIGVAPHLAVRPDDGHAHAQVVSEAIRDRVGGRREIGFAGQEGPGGDGLRLEAVGEPPDDEALDRQRQEEGGDADRQSGDQDERQRQAVAEAQAGLPCVLVSVGAEAVAVAAHRLDPRPHFSELGAQALHVRVHGAGLEVAAVAPHVAQELIAAEGPSRAARQPVEELELGGGQAQLAPVQPHDVRREIDHQRLEGDALLRDLVAAVAPENRLDAQHQLARRERLDDVVVRPQLEADHAVGLGAARGQHDDRDAAGLLLLAQDAGHLGAGEGREHQVEHHQVGAFAAGKIDRLAAVRGADHPVARLHQVVAHQFDDVLLVVDHQNRLGHTRSPGSEEDHGHEDYRAACRLR